MTGKAYCWTWTVLEEELYHLIQLCARMAHLNSSRTAKTKKRLLITKVIPPYSTTGGSWKSTRMCTSTKTCLHRIKTQPIPIITIRGNTGKISRRCPIMHRT